MSKNPGLARQATRNVNRAEVVDRNFLNFLDEWDLAADGKPSDLDAIRADDSLLTVAEFKELFESQMASRHLDLEARAMRSRNEGFYTIGSSGHECNAVLGRLTRETDPAFLHYRSGGFMMERLKKVGQDPVYDTALSLSASAEDPISGGRHKVWGSVKAWVPPQTSTIASHLPKAVGAAVAIGQTKLLGIEAPVPTDSIVYCSFGDASANHATAQTAFNSAGWTAHQNLPCPILFVCEDNDIGISTRSPNGWIESQFSNRAGIKYFKADGLDLVFTYEIAKRAIDYCRKHRKPVFLHLKLKRLLGHAGTDMETEYRTPEELERIEAGDPLLMSAETALESDAMTAADIRAMYENMRKRVQDAARKAAKTEKITTRADVIKPLAPYHSEKVNAEAKRAASKDMRLKVFGDEKSLPENQPARHMAILINRALHDMMAKYPEMTLFGEDVAQKGGVYTVTSGLYRAFKGHRVFNTLLDETTILGMAQGQAMLGLLPFPEIQYLAYYHNACDQIRGEASSLQFFSNAQYSNGMVMRVASLAYQKGFGGHFHNDNSFAALRDIPGLIIACPSRGDDAAMMLRTLAALAKVDGRVCTFMEPIALYMTKDLFDEKDGLWNFEYPAPDQTVPLGEGRVYNEDANDLLIVTYGNGVPMSLRAAKKIEAETKKRTRVLDLRWLKPLNAELIAKHAKDCGTVLVVDEGRRTGGIAEEIFTHIVEGCDGDVKMARVAGEDTYIPLADAANLVLVQEAEIVAAAKALLK
ncbi:MAG TPA: thiamine pyrophosphate-dependent enzyme [Gammaproteobacteria bacterium]